MNSKKILIYLPEGFADWEGAYLMSELAEAKRDFLTVSEGGKSVQSIGRLKVQPEAELESFSAEQIDMLVLIGSDTWQNANLNQKAIDLAGRLIKQGTFVAAICGATTALARAGFLDHRNHTSNDLGMLKKIVPSYQGEKKYIQKLAVTEENLITASGIGPLEFTVEILKALNVYPEKKREQWYAMYKNGVFPPIEFWS